MGCAGPQTLALKEGVCIDVHQCCIAGHAGATFDVTYGSHTRIHTSRETDAELTSADFPPMTIEVQDYTDCRLLPQGVEAEQIAAQLRLQFDPQVVSQEARRLVLHDTFAWQLWFAGLVLCRIDQSAMLCHRDRLSPEEALVHCPADTDNGGALPKFWWDWDDANMRDALAGVIGLRAVRPVADILVQGQKINVRNGDAKTIARVVLERFVPSDHKSPERPPQAPVPRSPNSCALGICRVAAVRGYDDEHATVCETLSHGGLPWMDVSPLDLILEQSGCRPRKWSNKADCPVSSDLPAREATRRIAAASLRIVRRCEAGVIDDIDTEFLHDYRVNLRRVRSLLKLVGGVYPSETTQLLLNDLRDFARTTNRLRDLDVYLLHRTDYIKLLPPHQAQSLDWMFDDLSAERKLEQQAVAKHLQSDTYRWSIDRLEQIFQQDRWWPVTANSHLPIAALWVRLKWDRERLLLFELNRWQIGAWTEAKLCKLRIRLKPGLIRLL